MKVYYEAEWSVHGGPVFNGPNIPEFATDDESAMVVTYSHTFHEWIIHDNQGNVMAVGRPKELAIWMQQYLSALQTLEEMLDWNEAEAQGDTERVNAIEEQRVRDNKLGYFFERNVGADH